MAVRSGFVGLTVKGRYVILVAMAKPRILYVHSEIYAPVASGVHTRILNIGRLLKTCGPVTMVGLGWGINSDARASFEREFGQVVPMIFKPAPQPRNVLERWHHKFKVHWPTWWVTHKICYENRQLFARLRREHDMVWFHSLNTADAFGQQWFPRSVMDIDDLNHVKYALWAKLRPTVRSKMEYESFARKWRYRELRTPHRFGIVAVCSDEDRRAMGGHDRVHVLPNGFLRPKESPVWHDRSQLRLGFIGTMSYEPNADGLRWFGDHVWPLILAKVPEARLRIVGKLSDDAAFLNCRGFEPLGYVADTTEEFASWSASIVPLRFGGGTRLKILEAFSKMCPVVSTSLGAYGLEVANERELLLGDSPERFADACVRLLGSAVVGKGATGEALTRAGWALFSERYAWDRMEPRVKRIVAECLGNACSR